MIQGLIQNIVDIPGVAGACLFNASGNLYQDVLPSFYDKQIFDDLIRRVVVLYETIDDNYIPCDEYVLTYGDITVRLNRNKDCFLMVFVSPEANLMSVKMVSRLAIKNADSSVLKRSVSKPPFRAPVQEVPPTPQAAPPPAAPAAPTRRRVDDDDDEPRKRHSYRGTSY